MAYTHKLSVACVLFGLPISWTALAQTSSPKPESSLLQSMHVVGDPHDGFRKTCLIVYTNGEYHREWRRQISRRGRAQFDWEPPEVFEAKLSQADLDELRAILETPGFSSINGVVGYTGSLTSKVAFGSYDSPEAIIPHDNIDIVTVAVARPRAPQIFELADIDVARRQEPLRAFLNWINGVERSQAQHFAASEATNCSSLIATGNVPGGGALMAVGINHPKAIYAPGPRPPHDPPKPQPVAVDILINPDGSVAEASLHGRPSPDVAQSVLDAVRKWKFEPARLLGVPIATTIHVRVEFLDK
jgi:TonB family protein